MLINDALWTSCDDVIRAGRIVWHKSVLYSSYGIVSFDSLGIDGGGDGDDDGDGDDAGDGDDWDM